MTGNEILVLQGSQAVYGKVRHSGYDFIDWLKEVGKDNVLKMGLQDVWQKYYEWRYNSMTEISRTSEIESVYQKTGYLFDVPIHIRSVYEKVRELAEELLRAEEAAKQKNDIYFDEGFTCGYGDHQIDIDLDMQTISGIDADLEGQDDQD